MTGLLLLTEKKAERVERDFWMKTAHIVEVTLEEIWKVGVVQPSEMKSGGAASSSGSSSSSIAGYLKPSGPTVSKWSSGALDGDHIAWGLKQGQEVKEMTAEVSKSLRILAPWMLCSDGPVFLTVPFEIPTIQQKVRGADLLGCVLLEKPTQMDAAYRDVGNNIVGCPILPVQMKTKHATKDLDTVMDNQNKLFSDMVALLVPLLTNARSQEMKRRIRVCGLLVEGTDFRLCYARRRDTNEHLRPEEYVFALGPVIRAFDANNEVVKDSMAILEKFLCMARDNLVCLSNELITFDGFH
jgi:hypothetical protein